MKMEKIYDELLRDCRKVVNDALEKEKMADLIVEKGAYLTYAYDQNSYVKFDKRAIRNVLVNEFSKDELKRLLKSGHCRFKAVEQYYNCSKGKETYWELRLYDGKGRTWCNLDSTQEAVAAVGIRMFKCIENKK